MDFLSCLSFSVSFVLLFLWCSVCEFLWDGMGERKQNIAELSRMLEMEENRMGEREREGGVSGGVNHQIVSLSS